MSDLRFLLKLVDDPSPRVSEKIVARLREMGPALWEEIRVQNIELTNSQHLALQRVFALNADEQLAHDWTEIRLIPDENLLLEAGLLALAQWQNGPDTAERGRILLDEMARDFIEGDNRHNAIALANYLFDFRGLHGATPDDYYNPQHSNLVYLLEKGAGLPITLASAFILVGARLDIAIEGCNFPGHFLARDRRRHTIFDPYNGGRVLSAREVATLRKAAPYEMNTPATAQSIIERVIRNLAVAYHQRGESSKAELMSRLLKQ